MLMTLEDIERRMGQTFEGERIDQAEAFIGDVTGLVEDFLGRSYASVTPPAAVKAVACLEVIRYLNVDPGIASDRVGDLSTSYAYRGEVVVLSDAAKTALRPYRRRSGVGSIQLISRYVSSDEEEEETT